MCMLKRLKNRLLTGGTRFLDIRGFWLRREMEAIQQLSTESTIILVEQNFLVASKLAENYVIIEEGSSVKEGKMADLVNDKETI